MHISKMGFKAKIEKRQINKNTDSSTFFSSLHLLLFSFILYYISFSTDTALTLPLFQIFFSPTLANAHLNWKKFTAFSTHSLQPVTKAGSLSHFFIFVYIRSVRADEMEIKKMLKNFSLSLSYIFFSAAAVSLEKRERLQAVAVG
jgi:hypothetical protein